MELSRDEFSLLRDYIHNICGIAISDDKSYLIQQRLEPLVLQYECKNFGEFYRKIRQTRLPLFQEQIISAITTNETAFFRDGHPFAALKEYILPKWSEIIRERKFRNYVRKGAKLRLWSAGASTGQEPYSIAMIIDEYVNSNQHTYISAEDFGILASDISNKVLLKSMAGEYSQRELERGVSSDRIEKYFFKAETGTDRVISNSIRSMIEFRQINLIHPFTMLGGFDVIFCRNVLIYFDNSTKSRIIEQFHHLLSDKGFLILGATENVYPANDKFDSVRYGDTILYQKR